MVFQVHRIGCIPFLKSVHTYPCFQQAAVMQMQMNEAELNDLSHTREPASRKGSDKHSRVSHVLDVEIHYFVYKLQ